VLKLKTKWFHKWAKKNMLSDSILLKTIDNMKNHLSASRLGSGLFKVRTSKTGEGKSSGFRTILVFKESDIAIFVYGFAKNEKDNLDEGELRYFKKLSKDLLKIDKQKFLELTKNGEFLSIEEYLK